MVIFAEVIVKNLVFAMDTDDGACSRSGNRSNSESLDGGTSMCTSEYIEISSDEFNEFMNEDWSSVIDDILLTPVTGKTKRILLDKFLQRFTDEDFDGLADGSDDSSGSGVSQTDKHKYKTCIVCKKENKNTSFQYCQKCYQVKRNLFPPKQIQKESINETRPSTSTSVSNLIPGSCSQESTPNSSMNQSTESKSSSNYCITCETEPKNAIFVHGKTAHICCCYKCAIKVSKSNSCMRCPICSQSVTQILKAFYH